VVNGNHIFDTMEFKPGIRQVVVNYLLPYKGKAASMRKELTHNTSEVDIFLPEDSGVLSAPGFTSQPPFEIRGKKYQRYRAANLKKGSMLTMAVTGLSALPLDLRWLAPAVLVILFFTVFGLHRWRKSNRSPNESSKDALQEKTSVKERHRLFEQILQLDDAFEAGAIDKTTYFTAREKLKLLVAELDTEYQNL